MFLINLASRTLTSTSGVILVRAEENSDCCHRYTRNSIEASEDGQDWYRTPQVRLDGKCVANGPNGTERTFQEWVDSTVSVQKYGYALCFEGWKYIVKGT